MTRKVAVLGVVVCATLWVRPAAAQSRVDWLTLRGAGSSIGVEITELSGADANAAPDGGVRLVTVNEGTPAARAGFQSGDIVVEFDGERIRSARQFQRVVEETRPGREVKSVVVRNGERRTLTVTPELGRAVPTPQPNVRVTPNPSRTPFAYPAPNVPVAPGLPLTPFNRPERRLGATVTELNDQLRDYFGGKQGVLVTAVDAGTPAARAGLKAGDVIVEIGNRPVTSAADITAALPSGNGEGRVELHVIRDKKDLRLTATLPSTTAPAPRSNFRYGEPL